MEISNLISKNIELSHDVRQLKLQIEKLKENGKKQVDELKKQLASYKLYKNQRKKPGNSKKCKSELKRKIKNYLEEFNKELNGTGYRLAQFKIKKSSGEALPTDDFEIQIMDEESENDLNNVVNNSLLYKDLATISDRSYTLFRKGLKLDTTATLYEVKLLRDKLKQVCEVKELSTGFYIEPVRFMMDRIQFLISSGVIKPNEKIRIKLACDGTEISRNIKLCNLVFNVINESMKASTAMGCYRLGIFKIENENYESVSSWLPFIREKMKNINKIEYCRREKKVRVIDEDEGKEANAIGSDFSRHEVEYFFSADWKMMAIVLGLYAANSKYPCLFCEQSKDNLYSIGKIFY